MTESRTARLLAKANAFMSAKTFRYPVCLDADVRAELNMLRDKMETAATAAALAEKYPAKDDQTPTRRTIGDRVSAAQKAMDDMSARATELLDAAKASDDLVVVVFAIPADATDHPDGPAGWYRDLKDAINAEVDARGAGVPGPSKTQLVLATLPARSFVAVQSPDGEDIGMTWDDARRNLLDDADAEQIEGGVLNLYRGTTAVPFDPASFGARTTN